MKKRFFSLGLACLAVLLGWFVVAFRPAHSELGKLHADVHNTRAEVSGLKAELKRLVALEANEAEVRIQAERMATALPNDPKVSDFIIQVQNAANAAGIDFLTITPALPAVPAELAAATTPTAPSSSQSSKDSTANTAPPAPTTPLRSISVQIRADGKFFEIEDFTLKLEQLARALRIDQYGLTAGSKDENSDTLSATMTLQIFMVTPQAAAPGSAAQATQGKSGAA
jgi:Tfp pilus assembly protein PilO